MGTTKRHRATAARHGTAAARHRSAAAQVQLSAKNTLEKITLPRVFVPKRPAVGQWITMLTSAQRERFNTPPGHEFALAYSYGCNITKKNSQLQGKQKSTARD